MARLAVVAKIVGDHPAYQLPWKAVNGRSGDH